MSVTWEGANLEKDQAAEQLAKVQMRWDALSTQEQADKAFELVRTAQKIKETL